VKDDNWSVEEPQTSNMIMVCNFFCLYWWPATMLACNEP